MVERGSLENCCFLRGTESSNLSPSAKKRKGLSMKFDEKLKNIEQIVKKELSCSAYNLDHSMRVFNLCKLIAKNEKDVDMEVVQIAALMHDIGQTKESSDPSGDTDHAVESAKMAGEILKSMDFSESKIKHIQKCIISHRFRTANKPKTKEAQIVFDADKIDGIGAIGIARMFSWTGKNGAHIYKKTDLKKYAEENLTGGSINGRIKDKTKHSPQIEFEIKVGQMRGRLYTKKAKKIFDDRVQYMEDFHNRLEKEIEGKI